MADKPFSEVAGWVKQWVGSWFLRKVGDNTYSGTLTVDNKLKADTLAARSAAGMSLRDDGGNLGLMINDGGYTSIGKAGARTVLDVYGANTTMTIGHNTGNAGTVGVLFSHTPGSDQQKAGIFTVATGTWGKSDMYFCLDSASDTGNVAVSDAKLTIYNNGDAYFETNVSALSFTDRTKGYEGDALAELAGIKAKNGEIDHDTLPAFAKSADGGRDLGAMISMLTAAVQQLVARVETLEAKK